MRLRKRLLPASGKRHQNATVDLRTPGWWQRLGLPKANSEVPVLVMYEGVLMYLEANEVEHVLREFGQSAPAGSKMLFYTLSWLAIGCAPIHGWYSTPNTPSWKTMTSAWLSPAAASESSGAFHYTASYASAWRR